MSSYSKTCCIYFKICSAYLVTCPLLSCSLSQDISRNWCWKSESGYQPGCTCRLGNIHASYWQSWALW